MRIAVGTDEVTAVTAAVEGHLVAAGHELVDARPRRAVARRRPRRRRGRRRRPRRRGIVWCWTGTGVSIAANKVAGVRAALCTDAETARGRPPLERRQRAGPRPAADVGGLGAGEIVDAFLSTDPDGTETDNIARLP